LEGIGSKSCPKCEVPCEELGGDPRRIYETLDYMRYREKAVWHEPAEAAGIAEYFLWLGVKIENTVFIGLDRVSPTDLHKPDLLHNIALGLFKHRMEWVEGFLKKHKRQKACDDDWKEIPPYPGFSVPKKAYRQIPQWHGKEMRSLGHCISAVFASPLRDPDSSQYHDFKSALKCVSALVDFSLMAQYRSHTPDTVSYMESYLQTFHRTKDIFLEFRTSKATRTQGDRQDWVLRELMADQHAKEVHHRTIANRCRQADQERVERSDRRADLIRHENYFNFIKMYYLTHFASHVRRFGSISMYSTEIGELAHRDQIKDGYRRSNKNDAARQILSQYGPQHALGMRLQTIEALSKVKGVIVAEDSGMAMPAFSSHRTPRRVLKGGMKNTSMLTELCATLNIHYSDMMQDILRFTRQTAADDQQLPADPTELGLLPVEGFAQLEIPVADFQETDRFQIHRARCTGTKGFRNGGPRNDWVWVQTGAEANYGDLRGRVVAGLLALFKIRNILSDLGAVHQLALGCILDPVNSGRFQIASGYIRFSRRVNGRDMRIVSIGAVIGQVQVIPSGERQWIVNQRIDLQTFNEIY